MYSAWILLSRTPVARLAALMPPAGTVDGVIHMSGEPGLDAVAGGVSPVWRLLLSAWRGTAVIPALLRDRWVLMAITLLVVVVVVGEISGWRWARLRAVFSLQSERGRYVALTTAGGAVFLAIALLRPGAQLSPVFVGRLLFLFLAAVGAAWLLTARQAGRGFDAALESLARDQGMSLIESPADESGHPALRNLRRFMDRDTRRWELNGAYPYVYGERGGGIMTVRVPVGFDYDPGSPTSTRVACFKRTGLSGLTVRDRASFTPGRQKLVETGDDAFDRLFVVESRHAPEVEAVLTPGARDLLVDTGSVGYGLRADMFGVKVYLKDRVVDTGLLRAWLDIIERIAAPLEHR